MQRDEWYAMMKMNVNATNWNDMNATKWMIWWMQAFLLTPSVLTH